MAVTNVTKPELPMGPWPWLAPKPATVPDYGPLMFAQPKQANETLEANQAQAESLLGGEESEAARGDDGPASPRKS